MTLMSFRHKTACFLIWLSCFLTFYLGFNQQVMCFELMPNGEIYKTHLQLIECNPFASHSVLANLTKPADLIVTMATMLDWQEYPLCRDFHLSFKRKLRIDFSNLSAPVSFLIADHAFLTNTIIEAGNWNGQSPFGISEFLTPNSTITLATLRTTILLI